MPANANEITKFILTPGNDGAKPVVVNVFSSDGEKYDKLDLSKTTTAIVDAKLRCRYGNNAKWASRKAYEAELLNMTDHISVGPSSPDDGYSLRIWGNIGSGVDLKRDFRVRNDEKTARKYAKICNDEIVKKLSKKPNLSKYHFMAEGFVVDRPGGVSNTVEFTCNPVGAGFIDMDRKTTSNYLRVKCGASAKAKAKLQKPKPKLEPKKFRAPSPIKVSISADPVKFRGQCPSKITFKGKITARKAGKIKYRFVDFDGPKSGYYYMTFYKPGTKETIEWSKTIKRPGGINNIAGSKVDPYKPYNFEGRYGIEVVADKVYKDSVYYSGTCIRFKKGIIAMPKEKPKIKNRQ